jgi:hypothetical protein
MLILIRVMDMLVRADCFFCALVFMTYEHDHEYETCPEAPQLNCSMTEYWEWRRDIELGELQDCFQCGLPREICHRFDQENVHARRSGQSRHSGQCEYLNIMLPGTYILHKTGSLHRQSSRARSRILLPGIAHCIPRGFGFAAH